MRKSEKKDKSSVLPQGIASRGKTVVDSVKTLGKNFKYPNLIVAVIGPTASGKSDLAARLSRRFNGEIVSADSRQVYKELNIGTGKAPKDKTKKAYFHKGVRHHLIDIASPKRTFTAAKYQKLAREAIKSIARRSKLPIICGGTGFYIDSILSNRCFPAVPPQPKLRQTLERLSNETLYDILKKLDPNRAASIDRHNRRRLIRSLEIAKTTGAPVPSLSLPLQNNIVISDIIILKIGIKTDKNKLKKKIERRFYKWLREGLIEEVESLKSNGTSWKRIENLGLEYRAAALYLQKKISKKEMIDMSLREIWRYAKRQMTWFKRDKEINWIQKPEEAELLIRNRLKTEARPHHKANSNLFA